MRTDTAATRQLDAEALDLAYPLPVCAWLDCPTSFRARRSDAHYCSTAHRCRAWRHRRALAQLTTDHQNSHERPSK